MVPPRVADYLSMYVHPAVQPSGGGGLHNTVPITKMRICTYSAKKADALGPEVIRVLAIYVFNNYVM